MKYENFLTDYQRARTELAEFVVVTLTNFQGSAPQILGARMIVSENGYFSGTVGGGKLEMAAIAKAKELLSSTQPQSIASITWNLQTDLGMSCGGAVTLLFETQSKSTLWQIAIFGAGHVSQELTRVLTRLDCQVEIFDTRPEWINKLPHDQKHIRPRLTENLEMAARQISEKCFVVVATMGHSTDLPVLRTIFDGRKFPFVGAIGSEIKAKKLRANLVELGATSADCESLMCPIGEDFGNNTPPEIAISIVAQLLRRRDSLRKAEESLK